jgi:hypothetical protein
MVELIVDEEIKKAYRPAEEESLPEGAELDLESDFVNKTLDDELQEAESSEASDGADQSINELYLEIEYFPAQGNEEPPGEDVQSLPVVDGVTPKEYFAQAIHEENEVLFVVDLFDKLMCGYGKSWLKPKFLE